MRVIHYFQNINLLFRKKIIKTMFVLLYTRISILSSYSNPKLLEIRK